MSLFSFILFILLLNSCKVECASADTTKGTYKVINSATKLPCVYLQADIYLYLTYDTADSTKDVVVHVPTSSHVDSQISSCDTIITTSGMSVKSQLMRIDFDHMDGWSLDLAFTRDDRFKTDKESEFTLFQVNISANYASDPVAFPDSKYPTQSYYLHVDPNSLSDIASAIYAKVDNSYYCPSEQKYEVNSDDKYGQYAFIKFKLTTAQAYMSSATIGTKETCPTDQRTTDIIPIIVGSALAGLIILTLVVYLIYRSFLPAEVINLVNPESHFNFDSESKESAHSSKENIDHF